MKQPEWQELQQPYKGVKDALDGCPYPYYVATSKGVHTRPGCTHHASTREDYSCVHLCVLRMVCHSAHLLVVHIVPAQKRTTRAYAFCMSRAWSATLQLCEAYLHS